MNAIVAEARSWIGTPYVHQASVKGAGCDCLGLIRGLWRATNGAEPVAVPRYTPDWDEAQGRDVLWAAACEHLTTVGDGPLAAGQILLFRMRAGAVAKHLGVLANPTPQPSFVHAYSRHGVIESPLSGPWRKRVVARFELTKR